MKYFKVQVQLGHLGPKKELPALIFIKSKSILNAITKAKNIPAVKHSKLPPQTIEITEEEYNAGIESQNYYEQMNQIFNV